MVASRFKTASQIAKVISGMRHETTYDQETGLNFADDSVVTTGITPIEPNQLGEITKGGYLFENDLRIIGDILKPYEENVDYRLRTKRSNDHAFLKKVITDRGSRPA